MKPELKPCPFCNGVADFYETKIYGHVRCTECGAMTDGRETWHTWLDWRKDTADLWNERNGEKVGGDA